MVPTLCVLTCALAAPPAPSGASWQLHLGLRRGQELVYSGTFAEELNGQGVQFSRAFHLETRLLVLNRSEDQTEAVVMTVVTPKSELGSATPSTTPSSVRLMPIHIHAKGHVTGQSGAILGPPLEGPATLECGFMLESTRAYVSPGQHWELPNAGQPPMNWRVLGIENVDGSSCLKLIGEQKSADWDQPRADQPSWHRQDSVWLSSTLGVAYRFERIIERREPARREPHQRSVTRYTLDKQTVYPARLLEDRRDEIAFLQTMEQAIKPLLAEPERHGPRAFDAPLSRITGHMDTHPATPYRVALLELRRRIESAQRGEPVVANREEKQPASPSIIALGKAAPDFLVPDLVTHESARLHRFLGKPALLIFYSPTSKNAAALLKFAQALVPDRDHAEFSVVGLAVSDDTAAILKQRRDLAVTFPILSGQGLRTTYAVDATPKFVVLDSAGVVHAALVGWGREIPETLTAELRRWKRGGIGK